MSQVDLKINGVDLEDVLELIRVIDDQIGIRNTVITIDVSKDGRTVSMSTKEKDGE